MPNDIDKSESSYKEIKENFDKAAYAFQNFTKEEVLYIMKALPSIKTTFSSSFPVLNLEQCIFPHN